MLGKGRLATLNIANRSSSITNILSNVCMFPFNLFSLSFNLWRFFVACSMGFLTLFIFDFSVFNLLVARPSPWAEQEVLLKADLHSSSDGNWFWSWPIFFSITSEIFSLISKIPSSCFSNMFLIGFTIIFLVFFVLLLL